MSQNTSTEGKLVGITRYVSPVYVTEQHKIAGNYMRGTSDRIIFLDSKKDDIMRWLQENALSPLKSDGKYLFMAEKGAHLVMVSRAETNPIPKEYRGRHNRFYERRVTIKSQPPETPILEGLERALDDRGFKKVEQFKDDPFSR